MTRVSADNGPAAKKEAARSGHPEDTYGRELPIVKDLGIGPTMAARVVGKTLYTIGHGILHIADISGPADPKILGKLDGLGNTRQIAVSDGIAYITSREHGVFIVDVKNHNTPKLLCHYDAIEVATGIDIAGDVMFVACRSHGVELVDVSDPRKPHHLSTARTGEAQSVAVQDGYAYVGVWGSSELVVVNARNAREPEITARCRLDGFGDGVAVRGKYVYVATGHHSRERSVSRPKEGDPGYGCGHGLEIFKISDPAKPVFVSRIKTPAFYRIGQDMWSVKITGDYAFVADTYNGVFVVNIKDPSKPFFVAHRQLPYVERTGLPGYVGGLALTKDYIYVAGGATDLHVVAAKGLALPAERDSGTPPTIPPFKPRVSTRFRVYGADGQVRAVALMDDTVAVAAAGSGGIHVVELGPKMKMLKRYETEGFAMDIAVCGDVVYAAEDKGGMSTWRRSGQYKLVPLGRYRARPAMREVVVPPPGRYALLMGNISALHIVDVSDPAQPRCVFEDKGYGFLYRIAGDLIDNRRACTLWQIGGLRWYDLYGGPKPSFTGDEYHHRLGSGGVVIVNEKALVIYGGGIVVLDAKEHRPPGELEVHRCENVRLRGDATRHGNVLYLSNRTTGDIAVVDIADVDNPRLLEHFNVPGNPGRILVRDGEMIIPNGYEGLWVEQKK